MKKRIKKLTKTKKSQDFISKYNIPYEYIAVNRTMVTKALLIGLFIALLPIPMQMVVVIVMMKFLKFNVPLAILLCWITNPNTMPFIYYVEYSIGSFILNTEVLNIQMNLEWFNENIGNIFMQLCTGSIVLATVVSGMSYFIVNYLWIYFVNRDKKVHYTQRKKK